MIKMVQFILFTLFLVILANESVILGLAHFCRTKTSCFGIKIDEPFWIDDGSLGEGCNNNWEFTVKCARDGMPVMNISNNLYTLLRIDRYGDGGNIAVREAAINGQECPQPQQNFSIGSSRFLKMFGSYAQKRIFYDCSIPPPNIQVEEGCYNNSTKHSYVFWDGQIPGGFDWFRYCERNVLTYVDDDNIAGDWGFTLSWKTPVNCTDCELSGGRCSSNETITCYCPRYEETFVDEICPRGVPPAPSASKKSQHSKQGMATGLKIMIGVLAGMGGLLLVGLLVLHREVNLSPLSISHLWNKNKSVVDVKVFLEKYECLALRRYKYSDIKKMTNSFRDALGEGGYGRVFKGELRDGRLVAVKVLKESKSNGEDFINEVATISRTNHVNVVNLVGFCIEGTRRAVVYEFMANGSLERYIFTQEESSTTPSLGWEKLYQTSLGIARGLEYLHRGCNARILHFDIKPHNILLDENFCPKISDFGLAKLYPTRESNVSTVGARGTMGYIAPELYSRNFGNVSHKSDVYSYGMMMLEMIGGRKNIDATVINISQIYFPHWIYNHLKRNNNVEDLQEMHAVEGFEDEKAKKMIIVALWCIQAHPLDRPSMSKVIEMLEGDTHQLQMPPKPFIDPQSSSSASS